MKTSRNIVTKLNKQGSSKKTKPEISDDMDSREHKEENYQLDKSKKGKKKHASTWTD